MKVCFDESQFELGRPDKKNWIYQPYPQYSLKQIHLMKQHLDTRLQESLCQQIQHQTF